MPATKTHHPFWVVALYVAGAFAIFITISGTLATGAWLASLLLLPILALLLPPFRKKIDTRERFLPGPKWSIGIALVVSVVQMGMFGQHVSQVRAEQEALQLKQTAERAATVKRGLAEEYATEKAQILTKLDNLLHAGQANEALGLANKYFAASKDPDLARLRNKAQLAVMELELQNESALSLERREQIYSTLIREQPGSLARYQEKLKAVTTALEAERKAKAEAQAQAQLEASIKNQFSPWDGSHRGVERELKSRMHNPDSYEHVETRYNVGAGSLTVYTRYRGTNGFGAVVTNSAVATVDMTGNVLSLSSQ